MSAVLGPTYACILYATFPDDLRLLSKEVEGWLTLHTVRNVEYVKIDAKKECRRFLSEFGRLYRNVVVSYRNFVVSIRMSFLTGISSSLSECRRFLPEFRRFLSEFGRLYWNFVVSYRNVLSFRKI